MYASPTKSGWKAALRNLSDRISFFRAIPIRRDSCLNAMIRRPGAFLAALFLIATAATFVSAEETNAARLRRGQILYIANCSLCHQLTGRGAAESYPPLAGSDYLKDHRTNSILAIVQGMSGRITVNGRSFDNQMPAAVLDDSSVADVLTFVYNSWGNPGGDFSTEEVRQVRSRSTFKTYEDLVKANEYPPIPRAPEGFQIRELARLKDFATRIASDGQGRRLYLLSPNGHVSRLDIASRALTNLFRADDYIDASRGSPSTLGMALDPQGRLWITCNQRNEAVRPFQTNEVTIFWTSGTSAQGDPIKPVPWFRTSYPWGIGPYNHGVSHLTFGRDGLLYVSSGSRTDGGEAGNDDRLGAMGETSITAALWRFNPKSTTPEIEVIARGIRNAWSFAWDGDGQLFTVSNGPDQHAGEEMDWVRPGKNLHHGFPFQFEDWPIGRKAYPHTPEAPPNLQFAHPVVNLGPDGWFSGKAGHTFHPHSSPAGMVWLDGSWPESVRNSFLIGRFGNLIKAVEDRDVGFDVLSARMEKTITGDFAAHTHRFLAPLGRPIDIHMAGGRIYILEYTRPTTFKDQRGWLPGRVLELTPSRAAAKAP
ncbi:MAG: c-type cytochrome [Pedosphaera sp.]|nr:c-type cytochrome [Pedosphaera sp.]